MKRYYVLPHKLFRGNSQHNIANSEPSQNNQKRLYLPRELLITFELILKPKCFRNCCPCVS